MLVVNKIEDTARFETLREEWNELLANSSSDRVFLRWEWLFTWWKHLAEDRRLHLVTLRSGGELIAIAPLAFRSSRWRRLLPFPALEFLGSGSVGSDYLDVLIRRGWEQQALAALAVYLADCRFMVEFSRVERASAQASALACALNQAGWVYTLSTTDVCPYIDLAGHDWESYLATLGAAHRYNVRRRLKNLAKQWRVSLERADSEARRHELLRQLVKLHRLRWHARGLPGVFPSAALRAFHEEFSRLALLRGWLRLLVLRLDEQPAAALYGLRYNGAFYFYQSGFDPAFRKHSVGLALIALAIRSALEEGVEVFDFLRGDEPYKSLWTHEQHELIRLNLFPPSARGAFYRQTMDLRWSIKRSISHYLFGGS